MMNPYIAYINNQMCQIIKEARELSGKDLASAGALLGVSAEVYQQIEEYPALVKSPILAEIAKLFKIEHSLVLSNRKTSSPLDQESNDNRPSIFH